LIDFGIAKACDRLSAETTTGMVKGKFSYMSPEQASGKPIDRRADLWAAGAVLYHMLAGRAPFAGDNQLATLHALISRQPPPPLPSRIPPEIATIVMRSLHPDLLARYETADEMQRELEAAIVGSKLFTTQRDIAAYVTG